MVILSRHSWHSLLLLVLPAAVVAQDPTGSSSNASSPVQPPTSCPTNLVKDGSFENLSDIAQSNWTVSAEDGAACNIVNDGFDSSGHAFWVYNPRLNDNAACTISQTVTKPSEASTANFTVQVLARMAGSSITCLLTGADGSIVLSDVPSVPANGAWSELNSTVGYPSGDALSLVCRLTCPPDGSLRIDEISLVADKGGSCGQSTGLSTIGNYLFSGCYTESPTSRILPGDATSGDDMTPEKCAVFCQGWPFFGTEYGRECFCGDNVAREAQPVPLAQCAMPCAGNISEICGDANRVSLYHDKTLSGPIDPPETVNGTSGFLGCYTEVGRPGGEDRTLAGASFSSYNMSLGTCESFCINEGLQTVQNTPYKYWGVEYGRECYCGDNLTSGTLKVNDRDCSQVCSGNKQELCGGSSLLSLYQYMAFVSPLSSNSSANGTSNGTSFYH